jgi:hypothetical protein
VGDLLARGALYGVVVAGTWRLPLFQFTGTGVLPGLDQVVPALPEGLHPLAVANWFTGANVDLDTGSGPVSPLDWLTAGGDPAPVARLASALRVSG